MMHLFPGIHLSPAYSSVLLVTKRQLPLLLSPHFSTCPVPNSPSLVLLKIHLPPFSPPPLLELFPSQDKQVLVSYTVKTQTEQKNLPAPPIVSGHIISSWTLNYLPFSFSFVKWPPIQLQSLISKYNHHVFKYHNSIMQTHSFQHFSHEEGNFSLPMFYSSFIHYSDNKFLY